MLHLLEQLSEGSPMPHVFVGKWEDPKTGEVYNVALPADRIEGVFSVLRERWRDAWRLPILDAYKLRAERAEAAWWHLMRFGEEIRLWLTAAEQGGLKSQAAALRRCVDAFILRSRTAYSILQPTKNGDKKL
jgi:hypothetical protein